MKLEVGELEKDLTGYKEQIAATEEAIKGFEEQLQQLTEAAAETKVCIQTEALILKIYLQISHQITCYQKSILMMIL